jgi:hypothetical protein
MKIKRPVKNAICPSGVRKIIGSLESLKGKVSNIVGRCKIKPALSENTAKSSGGAFALCRIPIVARPGSSDAKANTSIRTAKRKHLK